MTIFLPGVFRSPLNGPRGHWSQHARWSRELRHRTEIAILAAVGRHRAIAPSAPKVVTFCLHAAREWDDDNLRAALKPARDALVTMGLLDDDRPSARHEFVYCQVTDRRRGARRGVEITVVEQLPLFALQRYDDRPEVSP